MNLSIRLAGMMASVFRGARLTGPLVSVLVGMTWGPALAEAASRPHEASGLPPSSRALASVPAALPKSLASLAAPETLPATAQGVPAPAIAAAQASPVQAPPVQAPPVQAPPTPAVRTPVLPPGWVWGVESDGAGNRVLVPVAPGEPLPARVGTAEDPVERARGRLEMLRMALEAYHATHRPGLAVYPEARSMDELARILRRERTLPEGWEPGGVVTEFKATSTGYLIRVAAGREILTIEPPHRDNPLAMFWLPPHRP